MTLKEYAQRAFEDLFACYFDQERKMIIPTWTGIPVEEVEGADPRGGLWERGMMLHALESYLLAGGPEEIRDLICAEGRRMKALYTPQELCAAGTFLHNACDDCGWHAWLYMLFFRYDPDEWYLQRAMEMMDASAVRWLDNEMGGGMWYENTRTWKSLYQVGIVLTCLEIYEHSGNGKYFALAMECYNWMHSWLGRSDGLYWADRRMDGPVGQERPGDIREAGSVSFLGGNMAMAAIHARLYRITGFEVYHQRVLQVCRGLKDVYVRDGCFINDRDAWTNTTFLSQWVREVTILEGFDPTLDDALIATAISVAENARTPDGHYSAVWRGPAEDPNHRWVRIGSVARQIMTSSTGVNWIMCALWLSRKETGECP